MPSKFLPYYLFFLPLIEANDECFTSGQFFGIVFGSIIGAFIICAGIGLALWYLHRKHEQAEKIMVFERAHATQETDPSVSTLGADYSEKGMVTERVQIRDRISFRDKSVEVAMPTPLPRRRHPPPLISSSNSPQSQRSRSLDLLHSASSELDARRRQNQELALSRFGFSIETGDPESPFPTGIFIDQILPGTPAEMSGNIFSGDRIKTLTISFDDMTFDDALAILSLVSDYTIRLDLERVSKIDGITQTDEIQEEKKIVEMRLPFPMKSMSSKEIRKRLKCRQRHCESLEYLNAPALPKKKVPETNKILPNCKCSIEEERIVHIVRHAPRGRRISVEESDEVFKKPPEGHALIRASEFEKKIKESLQIESRATKERILEDSSTTTSTESVPGIVEKQINRAVVISSEATVAISESTQLEVEASALTPEPEVLEEIIVEKPEIQILKVPTPSPETVLPELMIEVEQPVHLTVTSPKQPPESLTPDFVEVRAQRFSKEFDDGIVDRKLPPIPSNSLKRQKNEEADPGQLYLQIRNNLKEVYTGKTRETSLSEEQFNTLEANRRRLELEKQHLREMGII